jgi:hypothetical protein
MATLDQLRSLFPDAQSDSDVIKQAATEFGIDPSEIASEIGFKVSAPGMWTSVKRGIGQVESALGSTARDLGADRAGRALESYGEDVTFRNPAAVNTVGEALSSPWQTAKEAVGELVPQVGLSAATALGGRAIGGLAGAPLGPAGVIAGQAIGGSAGAYLGNLAQEYGGIRAEQRESGREDKTRALATGAAAAALDTAFGAERLVNKVGNKGLDILSRGAGEKLAPHVLKQTGLGIAGEAGTETIQTALERTGAFKDLLGADALNEYGMAAIKGGIGGGAVRGGMSLFAGQRAAEGGGNDVSQAFESKDTTQPDITTQQFQAAPAPAPAMREQITEDGEIIQVPVTQTQQAPAVAGGSTEIAQAQQQAQAAQQQQQAQAEQAQAAQQAAQQFGVVNPATPAVGSAFGQKVYGPNIPAVASAIANFTSRMPPQQVQLAQAITKANAETGGQLISFQFNANNVMASVEQGLKAVGKVATKLQIDQAETVEEAAAILNDQSTQLKGDKLEQVNAIHVAITGQNTTGYEAAQQPKGAKDDRLQLQNNAGLREVPVSGGATETSTDGDGGVRPAQVQPVGATSIGAGPSDVQAGQPSTSGVRPSAGNVPSAVSGETTPQVSEATNVQTTQGNDGGREPGQPKQADNAKVDSQGVRNGPRRYAEPPSYYATDLAHIKGERRIEIIKQLFAAALAPKTARKNTVPAETRAEFLRLALMEQLPHKTIAELTGVKLDTVEKQLERMGVELVDGQFEMTDPTLAQSFVTVAADYRSPEFPDGLGEAEVLALYTTRYEADEVEGQTLAEEIQAGEQEGKPQAKLAEELYSKDSADTKTMGTISSAGGSQGAVEATDDAFFAKVGRLQALLDTTPETDEAGRANLAKQIEAQWAQYAKKQATRAETGEVEVAPTEDEDAVQEPSAEEVPVRKRAKSSKAVGKGNAEGGKSTRESREEKTKHRVTYEGKAATVTIVRNKTTPEKIEAVTVKPDGERFALINLGAQGVVSDEKMLANMVEGDIIDAAVEPKQEVVVLTPVEKYEAIAADYPLVPPYESLTKEERARWEDLASRTEVDVTDIARVVGTAKAAQTQRVENDRTIDGTGLVREITPEQIQLLEAPVSKLTEGQTVRLERHYGAKRGTSEFLTKLHEDISLYAAKGVEAVNAAIRDIVKAVYTALLAVAVVFNPTYMNKAEAYTFSPAEEYSVTKEVRAEAPAEAASKMSAAAKEAYATLMPALKAELTAKDKLLVMADKPSGRIFVFTPNGKLVLEKKSLFGLAKGDFYKGNNDLPANRITPAGLHNIVMVDAAKGGGAAKTAGEYDFGKVFGIVDKNPGVLTIMHSVWLKEADAAKRVAALKSESAADSRYSFGCINVDKDTYKNLIDNYGQQMDGAKLFVVPDNQERLNDFVTGKVAQNLTGEDKLVRQAVTPVTETTTGTRQNVNQTATERSIVGKEEEIRLASKSAPSQFMDFDEAGDQIAGLDLVREQLEEAGIGHAVDLVSDWELTNDRSKNAEHGSLRTVQGRYVGTLNMAKLGNANYAAEVARHEIAHAIDMGPHGGIYSAQPEMGVSVVNGKINAEGPVAKELFALYKNDPKWNKFLEYPFDSTKHPELNNRTKVQLELFAQAFSIYTTPEGRAILEAQAPITAAYFKEVIQDVKSTKPLQIQKAEIAALRAAVLYTRRESKGNRGPSKLLGFDERVDELLASRSSQFGQEVKASGVFSKAGEWLDAAITSPKETLHKLKLGFLTLDQLAELDKSPGQVVRAYSDVMTAMQKTSKDLVYKAAQIDQLWAKLSKKDSDNVSQVMRDATRAKFDPSLGVAGKNQTEQDIMDAYRALPSSAKDVYAKVKKYYEDAFATRLAIMEESAAKLGGKELKEIQELYSKLKGPYFPLGRTGRYYAVGMSPRVAELTAKKEDSGLSSSEATELAALRKQADQYKTSSYNTLYEAKKAAEEFKKSMGDSYYNEVEENIESAMSKMPNFAKLEESITTKLGGETRAEVKSMLSQLMFDSLPEHHALKNQMRREGIYGENEDMRQVFAQTSISQAHYISRLQFGGELNQAMLAVAKSARKDIEMRQIQNELKLRTKLSMDNTQSALTDSMVNASYFAHLGLSPAFLLTNMTQVPMITAPWLGARHGVGATKRAMAMALADTAKIIKSTYKDGDWRSELNWNSLFPEGSNEDRMFRDLLDRNVLDITMEHDLAAVASAQKGIFDDKISKATSGKLGGMSDVVKLVNTPVRITELANRAVTALSAYRMKMEALATAPMTPEERHTAAVNYAARAVSETQLNYSELNAPRHMRQVFGSKPLAKMIFQFRKYQQGMLYLIAKNISDALPGSNATAEDRRIARRTIAGLYATTGLMAGTTGMPLMGTVGLAGIANLIAAAFGDEDEPWDFETEYRNFLTDWLGKDMALLVAKGLPAYLGADLSKRVGMGDIANPIPFVQRGQTGQSTVANVLYAAGGAPVGMVGTMYDGIVAMANGDVMKGMEKVIPVKAVKDALRTYRYADEGMTDKRGNVILPPEKFDAWDLTLRGMGFAPTKESEYYAANAAMQTAKTAATDVRTSLLREYSEAKLKGESTQEVDAKIVEFNERHPEKGVKIDMSTKLKSVQARRKMAAERTESGLRVGKYEKPFASEARFADQE